MPGLLLTRITSVRRVPHPLATDRRVPSGWLKRQGGRERGSRSTTQCWREGSGALQDGPKLSAEPGGWGAVDDVVVKS